VFGFDPQFEAHQSISAVLVITEYLSAEAKTFNRCNSFLLISAHFCSLSAAILILHAKIYAGGLQWLT
jgi:hypothetical protein